MAEGPLLSVVVPFYNVEAYIRDCLESLRHQTLTDLEVIMVDDGSLDGSIRVAEEYAAMDPRFRVVRQENQGLGPARNTGTAVATGRYLTFVDSDDLVAPRAYSQLVGSLERTGSSFAGGNAYRFSAAKGVYQSWTHRQPFAEARPATTIDEFPELMRDRMVWNKVYRRSYWDEQGFAFPAIRYEDYPVTLPAYLRARTVDVLAEHVYFWRDRESGDSITQQAFRLDNVKDRVASAELVLLGLDDSGSHPVVRDKVHGYFIDIDLVALAEALVRVPETDRLELERLATGLADRLDPASRRHATRLARLVHRSLRARDLDLVRALARWRGGAGTKQLVAEVRALPGGIAKLPAVLNAVTPRKKPQNPLRARRLRCTLVASRWRGDTLHVEGLARLRGALAARATGRAQLRDPHGRIAVPAQVEPTTDGLRWSLDLTPDLLRQVRPDAGDEADPLLEIQLRVGLLRWNGWVRFEPADLPPAHRIGADAYQLRGEGWHLRMGRQSGTPLACQVTSDGTTFGFTLDTDPAAGTTVVVQRPYPTPDVVATMDGRQVRIAAADLLADDPPDNPVTRIAERELALRRPDGSTTPLWLVGEGARAQALGRTVTLTRGWSGGLVARQEPGDA